jgi:hypothetical protein
MRAGSSVEFVLVAHKLEGSSEGPKRFNGRVGGSIAQKGHAGLSRFWSPPTAV